MAGALEAAIRKQAGETNTHGPQVNDQLIGEILVAQGVLKETDIDRVLRHAEQNSLLFGEAAVALKLVRRHDLDKALARQFRFPYVQPTSDSLSDELVVAHKPFSREAEVFRNVRATLMLGGFQKDQKVLAIVSPQKKDGRSYITANLAVAFAQMGRRTLLIDCHLREPRQHKIFQLERGNGLAALLSGRKEIAVAADPVNEIPNLQVLTSGASAPNPEELIAADAFGRLIQSARRAYEIILIDTPPGDAGSAVDWIAARSGNVLIINRRDTTRLSDARDFADRMRSRSAISGAILNTH